MMKVAMTIAGSDSIGGAGIQADLKTFYALGVYGTSAITAVTAQNTAAVEGAYYLPPEFVGQQIEAIAKDVPVAAVKTGMLASADIVREVARRVKLHGLDANLVVDPVLVSTSGHLLLDNDAVDVVKHELIPLALVITPNIPEAEVLSGKKIKDIENMKEAAYLLHKLGARNVLVKGGHANAVDVLFDGTEYRIYQPEVRVPGSFHGTGCTLSAAIAAELAKGGNLVTAVEKAKSYVTGCIKNHLHLGQGAFMIKH